MKDVSFVGTHRNVIYSKLVSKLFNMLYVVRQYTDTKRTHTHVKSLCFVSFFIEKTLSFLILNKRVTKIYIRTHFTVNQYRCVKTRDV